MEIKCFVVYIIIQAELLISLRMSLTVSLLFLTFISGVVAQDGWAVNYSPKSICALKGSEVIIGCTYTYSRGQSVQNILWTKYWITDVQPPDLFGDPEYRGRVQFLGDKFSDCTLKLRDVREKDQSKYYFRFITHRSRGKYQGAGGVDLSVTDIQVEVPERVIEGDNITLTCKTSCSLTVRPTFTWYRDGHPLSSSTDQLQLQPVSREDAGRYHCAVLGQNLGSPQVILNVMYGPKSVSVSVSPSGEIVEGSSVNLTCSSDANPSVQNYTWFKKLDHGVLQKSTCQIYSISNISSFFFYSFICSTTVLYFLDAPKKALVSINETAESSSDTLTCSSDANPPVQNYTWFKEGGSSPIGSGHSYRALQRGSYYCVAQNEHGSQKSAAVTFTVKGIKSVVLFAVVGVLAGCGCLFVIIAVLCVRKKRQGDSANASERRQKNLYNSVTVRSTTNDATTDPDPSSQDVHYSSVLPLRVRHLRNAESSVVTASAFGADEKVQYADTTAVDRSKGDVQYASVRFTHRVATNS
ncbi:B-cell receptor CD22-like [Pygocentrus nattereri]|uniref:B-cell receptor CD22-like n=1 Tax=Pygocentrus nattereri TaxID=42514 RepID=UPI0018916B82|nr:B-cell receptor CD22-like [Pygocentrus nattereri]